MLSSEQAVWTSYSAHHYQAPAQEDWKNAKTKLIFLIKTVLIRKLDNTGSTNKKRYGLQGQANSVIKVQNKMQTQGTQELRNSGLLTGNTKQSGAKGKEQRV